MPSSPGPGSVGLARAHPLTKTQAMEPSRQTQSSHGPPYQPVGALVLNIVVVSVYIRMYDTSICMRSRRRGVASTDQDQAPKHQSIYPSTLFHNG